MVPLYSTGFCIYHLTMQLSVQDNALSAAWQHTININQRIYQQNEKKSNEIVVKIEKFFPVQFYLTFYDTSSPSVEV